mmetsp:Transcript_73056/g.200583  ORF Transcript_73056/g.200583 Transcript_73056/m.200583 type:complete len:225 (-) Transcript_73056:1582-2256(-)
MLARECACRRCVGWSAHGDQFTNHQPSLHEPGARHSSLCGGSKPLSTLEGHRSRINETAACTSPRAHSSARRVVTMSKPIASIRCSSTLYSPAMASSARSASASASSTATPSTSASGSASTTSSTITICGPLSCRAKASAISGRLRLTSSGSRCIAFTMCSKASRSTGVKSISVVSGRLLRRTTHSSYRWRSQRACSACSTYASERHSIGCPSVRISHATSSPV